MKKILCVSFILSILQSILFWHKTPGISILIFTTVSIALLILILKENNKIKNKKGLLWIIPIELLALTYFIFYNSMFEFLNIPIILILTIIMCVDITEGNIKENKFIRNMIKRVFKPISLSISTIKKLKIKNIFNSKQDEVKGEEFKQQTKVKNEKLEFAKKLTKSIIISIPVLIIIIMLLSSADSVFGEMFKSIPETISKIFSEILSIGSLSELIQRVIWVAIWFMYILGFIVLYIQEHNEKNEQEMGQSKFNISSFTSNTMLTLLNIIYLIFSIIQFKYLFMNAGKTSDFDYANYARSGFFQLMFVSFINFVLLKISTNTEKLGKILKVLLVVFTIIIVISAAFRMHLYEQEYGYTYLRLFVYFTLLTEILILIPVLMSVLGIKLNVFKLSLQIIVVVYVVINFINIDSIIVKNNVNKYVSDLENNTLDVSYLIRHVETNSIKEKIKILDISDEGISEEAKTRLNIVKDSIKANLRNYSILYSEYYVKNTGFLESNLSKMSVYELTRNLDLSIEKYELKDYYYNNSNL